jgi:hypothetical protein
MTHCEGSFEMTVDDVFSFADGKTVYLGNVLAGPTLITAVDCALIVDGVTVTTVQIDGEMAPLKHGPDERRSVWSSDPAPDVVRPPRSRWLLRGPICDTATKQGQDNG